MIEQLIAHLNTLVAGNPALMNYLRVKRVGVGVVNKAAGYPQLTLDYWDAAPTAHKGEYAETMRVHLLLWHDTSPEAAVKANTMSTLLTTLLKNTNHDGVHFHVVGREALGVSENAASRTRIQLDLS